MGKLKNEGPEFFTTKWPKDSGVSAEAHDAPIGALKVLGVTCGNFCASLRPINPACLRWECFDATFQPAPSPMKTVKLSFALLFVAVLTGCSTPASRVARNQTAFDSWPTEIREQVRAGKVSVGFTMEQVRVALGEPDRVFVRTTSTGESEVWAWRELGPQLGIGVGIGTGGTAAGGSLGLGFEGYDYRDAVRVVFDHGKVTAIETRRR
jgi:hypothetical protein